MLVRPPRSAVAATRVVAGVGRPDVRRGQGQGLRAVRGQHRPGGLLHGRQPGQVDGARRRSLQGDRGGHVRRCREVEVHADHGAAALRRPAVGRGRRHHAQRHADPAARHLARLQHRRRQFLRRPGLPGAGQEQHQERQGAERRHDLRAARHHHRAQPRRLLPQEEDELQAGADRGSSTSCCRPTPPAAATPTRPTLRAWPPCASASSPARAST